MSAAVRQRLVWSRLQVISCLIEVLMIDVVILDACASGLALSHARICLFLLLEHRVLARLHILRIGIGDIFV